MDMEVQYRTQHRKHGPAHYGKPKLKLETKAHCDLSLYYRTQTKNSLSDMPVIRTQTNLNLARVFRTSVRIEATLRLVR